MDLKKYLELRKFEQWEFAALIGVTHKTISNYITGKRMPDPDIIDKIQEVTKGQVTLSDLLEYWRKHRKNG